MTKQAHHGDGVILRSHQIPSASLESNAWRVEVRINNQNMEGRGLKEKRHGSSFTNHIPFWFVFHFAAFRSNKINFLQSLSYIGGHFGRCCKLAPWRHSFKTTYMYTVSRIKF